MNVIKIMGGLGNQLFQYAFGRVQISNGLYVKFDCRTYDKNNKQKWPRDFQLNKFEGTHVRNSPFILSQPTIDDHKVGFNLDLLKLDNHNFHGYWQYLAYYEGILDTLRKEFRVKQELYNNVFTHLFFEITTKENSVSIHVRRGDYLVQTWGILPFTYYLQAVQHTKGDIYIFSDDIEWCKKHFKQDYFDRQITFVTTGEDCLDFELMRHCKHNIIGSSTFSWWAAMLNENSNKIVCAPSQWLGGWTDASLIYPHEWIKL